MKKTITGVAIALGLAVGVASAADLKQAHLGQGCADGGLYHFVNTKTGAGAAAGTLTATIGGILFIQGATQVNNNNQHFDVIAEGPVTAASTNLPGDLVLSHLECDTKEEPPKEDPSK